MSITEEALFLDTIETQLFWRDSMLVDCRRGRSARQCGSLGSCRRPGCRALSVAHMLAMRPSAWYSVAKVQQDVATRPRAFHRLARVRAQIIKVLLGSCSL